MDQTPVVFVVFHMFFAETADESEQTKKILFASFLLKPVRCK